LLLTNAGKKNCSFRISCPPPKTLSLELVGTKDYTTTAFTSTSDEPPSIEEVGARIVNALGLSVGLTGASIRMEAKKILGKYF
jgi:hypothetical protein